MTPATSNRATMGVSNARVPVIIEENADGPILRALPKPALRGHRQHFTASDAAKQPQTLACWCGDAIALAGPQETIAAQLTAFADAHKDCAPRKDRL